MDRSDGHYRIRGWGREEYQKVRKEGGGQEGWTLVSGGGEGRNIRRSGKEGGGQEGWALVSGGGEGRNIRRSGKEGGGQEYQGWALVSGEYKGVGGKP